MRGALGWAVMLVSVVNSCQWCRLTSEQWYREKKQIISSVKRHTSEVSSGSDVSERRWRTRQTSPTQRQTWLPNWDQMIHTLQSCSSDTTSCLSTAALFYIPHRNSCPIAPFVWRTSVKENILPTFRALHPVKIPTTHTTPRDKSSFPSKLPLRRVINHSKAGATHQEFLCEAPSQSILRKFESQASGGAFQCG